MTSRTFHVSGRVIERTTRQGLPDLRVEAWDNELIFDKLVGSDVTNAEGVFHLEFEESYFELCFLGRRPELYFKIFRGDTLIVSTENSVCWHFERQDIDVLIEVELPEPKPTPLIVQGQISQAEGNPLAGVTVRAFDQDLRHEELLGEKVTDPEGRYTIAYTPEQFSRAEKASADVIVRVFNAAGTLLVASDTLFNAPPVATVNLIVSADSSGVPSEYARLLAELEPLLAWVTIECLPEPRLIDKLADLKADDIAFLTGETSIGQQRLEFLATAAGLQKQAHEEGFELPAAVFYGLAREGLPLDLAALYTQGPQARRQALEQAFKDNIIPTALHEALDKILADLQEFTGRHALKTPPIEGGHSLSDLLSLALLSLEKQASLLALYTSHDGPIEEFWQKLRQQPDFQEPGLVDGIQRILQLGVLTQNHVPLIEELQRTHEVTSLRDLAKLDVQDWQALINTPINGTPIGVPPGVPGETPDEKVTSYVNGIVGLLQAAFSTAAVAQIVAKSPDIHLDTSMRENVTRFFANSPDLDFRTTRVDIYIAQHADTAFNGIPDDDRPQVVNHAKRLQRLLQVSTGPEVMTGLVNSPFDSAHAIANTPRPTFVAQMKETLGSEQKALAVYDRAQRVHAGALHVYTQIHQALSDVQPFVLGSSAAAVKAALLKHSPTLAELFGSLDLCDCEHCHSVLSPAAYLVDLLHLLENSVSNQDLQSPLAVLLKRRPDLEYIKLTCENTNTPLPYVDLVNEILESYVALGGELDATTAKDSGDSTADELSANPQYTNDAAYQQLKGAVYPLTLPYNQWLAVARMYLEHLGSHRDEVMRTFQSPGLPSDQTPDIPSDQDIACEYLGISSELRDVLTGVPINVPPDNLRDYNLRDFYGYGQTDHTDMQPTDQLKSSDVIALQRLLNSTGAKPLLPVDGIFDNNTKKAVEVFQQSHGITPADGNVSLSTWTELDTVEPIWLAYLAQVPEFLSHTGISYLELIELVKTRFINPNYQVSAYLEALNIKYQDLADWHDRGYLDPSKEMLDALNEAGVTLEALQDWTEENFEALQKVVVLYAPEDSQCELSVTGIRYVDGTDVDTTGDTDPIPIPIGILPSSVDDKAPTWQKLHRFIRLWRTLGWSMSDLDKTLSALGAAETEKITPEVLEKLAQVKRLQTDLKTPLVQLLSLWADIDTWGDDSLYKKLFLSKAVLSLDPVFQPALDGSVLTQSKAISGHVPAILAALRIGEADLNLIRVDADLAAEDATLTLTNISILYRYTVLARGLKLKIKDLIALKTLTGLYPFTPELPSATAAFADKVHQVVSSSFSIAQLNYLYRHVWEPMSSLAPQPEAVSLLAQTLRDGLQKIVQDTVLGPDPAGTLTQQDALSRSLVKQTLSDDLKLDSTVTQTLLESGLKAHTDANQPAIADFLALIGDGLSGAYFNNPTFTEPPAGTRVDPTVSFRWGQDSPDPSIPQGQKAFSVRWTGKLLPQSNETYTFHLRTSGGTLQIWINNQPIADQGKVDLKAGQLYDIKVEYARTTKQAEAIAELQWSSPSTPAAVVPQSQLYSGQAFTSFEQPLQSYYLLHKAALLVNTFKITGDELRYLSLHPDDFSGVDLNLLPLDPSGFKPAFFEQWLRLDNLFSLRDSLPQGSIGLTDIFGFAASNADKAQLSRTAITPLETSTRQTPRVITMLTAWISAAGTSVTEVRIREILRNDWTGLSEAAIKDRMTHPTADLNGLDVTFIDLLARLNGVQLLILMLTTITGWEIDELADLIGPMGLHLAVADFKNEMMLLRLQGCIKIIRRLGVSAGKLFDWASHEPDPTQARDIKKTVRAKYDEATWLTVAKPLSDKLRESQKAALIAYVLAMTDVANADQLFEYFLIDVEMSACMTTSRIKQAISSVQLFIDRCLMNLEPDVRPDAIDPNVWQWMKHYRIWEANRKVFLYPENWIEPELRDNKTPFFKELESELLQNDLTMDTAETAFLNYLEKLDEVARLEICGMYWQDNSEEFPTLSSGSTGTSVVELQGLLNEAGAKPPIMVNGVFDEDTRKAVIAFQTDNRLTVDGIVGAETWVALDSSKTVNILHVFGRTLHTRHIYYYRQLINNASWTPWEKVPVDIEGDHLIPVVWNRRLYIFWPIFMEKAEPQGNGTTDPYNPPPKYWEIKLAWSEYKQNKWSAKVISEESIRTRSSKTPQDKSLYTFKAIFRGDALVIWFYYSSLIGEFRVTSCHGRVYTTNMVWGYGPYSIPVPISGYLATPENSCINFMTFMENGDPRYGHLKLVTGNFGDEWNGRIASKATHILVPTLASTPSTYRILYPHQYYQYILQAPFFYQDDRRTYFVTPTPAQEMVSLAVNPNLARLERTLLTPVRITDIPITVNLGSGGDSSGAIARARPHAAMAVQDPLHTALETSTALAPRQPLPSLPGERPLAGVSAVSHGVTLNWATRGSISRIYWPPPLLWQYVDTYNLRFAPHFHPYVCGFIKSLNQKGIPGLLAVNSQLQHESIATFATEYHPDKNRVELPYPSEEVDFSPEGRGAYSLYNWELFFHSVMLIATRLSQNQRFDEARRWFHYIFDPTDNGSPGLLAAYYNSVDLSGPPAVRLDSKIDFAWGGGAPLPSISPTNFSVRWTGKLIAQYSETYTFYTYTDDGVRLWIDDELIIPGWWDQAPTELSVSKKLRAGVSYDIKMEYYQRFGGSIAQLWWSSPSTPKGIIPASRFYSVLYWKVLPFMFAEKERIWDLLTLLSRPNDELSEAQRDTKKSVEDQIKEWQQHPFQPHRIARSRLVAYQKNVVMKYLDNLIAWGDQLFRQETIESINEATQLYILAANILGPRPQRIPERGKIAPRTYAALKGSLDAFSNALVMLENEFPFSTGLAAGGLADSEQSSGILGLGKTLYFCTPQNDKLLSYWDTVADRLFKIRHCMNIEGVVQQLPLFEPPIDPALLVRAAAAGIDLSSVLNDINTPLPHYRFNIMLQKAAELCAEVKGLGSAFLSALEKIDAEALALLRSGHEIQVLTSMRQVKEQQVAETEATLEGLGKYHDVVKARQDYFTERLKQTINPHEQEHQDRMNAAMALQTAQAVTEFTAGILHLIPDVKVGALTTIGATYGGRNVGGSLQAFGSATGLLASIASTAGSMSATLGGYDRRAEEWTHQLDLATKELDQVQKQIDAANIRVDIANQELQNHDLQMNNAKEVDAFMRDKFTNQELYSWTVSQVSALYFQSYQLAYEVAKRAEKAYRFELGLTDSNFIQFGYWDSLKKGLLAGEKLSYDLKRMEMAYLDKNKREYEITRYVSLVLHDPLALISLKEAGHCEIVLPETLFDADYPGHYMRRMKSVSLTIPCVVGPYTSINCTLTLLSNETRINTLVGEGYAKKEDGEDTRFITDFAAVQSIATSHAQNDSGLFELNFRDERYLPFEGAGAISRWRIDMPKDTNAFDFNTLSDVVMHLKYTAREGGDILRNAAKTALNEAIADQDSAPLMRLFSVRHEFPDDWYRFLHPTAQNATSQTLTLDLSMERFPYVFRGHTLHVSQIDVFLNFKDSQNNEKYRGGQLLAFTLTPDGGTDVSNQLDSSVELFGGTPHKQVAIDLTPPTKLSLEMKEDDIKKIVPSLQESVADHQRLRADAIDDLWLIVHFSVEPMGGER